MSDMNRIKNLLPLAARYEQLAEECMELGKAALKKARLLRKENYTPISIEAADRDLVEEFTDVNIAAESVDLQIDDAIATYKFNRWCARLEKAKYDETNRS